MSYKKEKAEQSIADNAWKVTSLWQQLEIKIPFIPEMHRAGIRGVCHLHKPVFGHYLLKYCRSATRHRNCFRVQAVVLTPFLCWSIWNWSKTVTAGYGDPILSLVKDSCLGYDTLTWDKMYKNHPGKEHNNSTLRKCLKISIQAWISSFESSSSLGCGHTGRSPSVFVWGVKQVIEYK